MHGIILAKYEQRGCNCTGKISKKSTFNRQGRKLCCICYGRLKDSIHGILGLRILPTDRTLAHQLKKLVVRYFLQKGIIFKKG